MFTDLLEPARPASTEGPAAVERFLHLLGAALQARSVVRLVLSKPVAGEDLERVMARPVTVRGVAQLQLVFRHPTKDVTKNLPLAESVATVGELLATRLRSAHLFTRQHELQLSIKHKGARDKSFLRVGAAAPTGTTDEHGASGDSTSEDPGPQAHNRAKHRVLSIEDPVWLGLGISHRTDAGAAVVPAMARKWKQINKFTEVLESALQNAALTRDRPLRVIDFGCGRGYLTFAMHAHLTRDGQAAQVTGVELRRELVDQCNAVADAHARTGLHFEAGDVRSYAPGQLDVMVALHACDTATDHAIHLGLQAGAAIIMCSPCCHKEIRPQMKPPAALRPLLHHGVHLGQEAEMVTDSLRALLLEAAGYHAQIFEFVSLEHTNKNKMILAVRKPHGDTQQQAAARAQIAAIKSFYGLREQCLERLLSPTGQGNEAVTGAENAKINPPPSMTPSPPTPGGDL